MTMDEGRVVGLADQFLKKTRDKLTRRRKVSTKLAFVMKSES